MKLRLLRSFDLAQDKFARNGGKNIECRTRNSEVVLGFEFGECYDGCGNV
ncbi:MAG TPA: hypothetical protein VMY06_08785 [Sedimentisphaerales bacterium]|nr:hypothetical protein [Sedimentisphaerales bacterium]